MSHEVAINVPFDAAEIKDIAGAEFRKRLDGLSPLMGMKEYAYFELEFQVKIKLRRTGENGTDKETLAWGAVGGSQKSADLSATPEVAEVSGEKFKSQEPNKERVERDMPLTIETSDGKGGKVRRKARVK